MKISKQARRDAKRLFRGCVVNGVLDDNRARQTVQQISGRKPKKNARTDVETQRAVRSGWPSAMPFGTSSPITTCR